MRQLIKVGALSQSYSWALSVSIKDSLIKQIVTRGGQLTKVVIWASSLGTVDPLPRSRPWDENTGFLSFFLPRLSFPGGGNATQNFKDFPPFLLT